MRQKHSKPKIFSLMALLASVPALLTFVQIASNSWHIHSTSKFLRAYAHSHLMVPGDTLVENLDNQIRSRAALYITEIKKNHLDDGLVINRSALGSFRGNCDSLLFSSLFHASLVKLHKHELAAEVWKSIRSAQKDSGFIRHPDCQKKATSRDQILGLIVAMSQKPEGYRIVLAQLFNQLAENNGYFSHGSPSVSYMTPGLADIIRRFARVESVAYDTMPDSIRRSFSTLEASVPFVKRGYRTHLSALQIWLEMELENRHPHLPPPRSLTSYGSTLFRHFTPRDLSSQRLEYLTQTLVERQPNNLFYRYLRYRAANALSPAVRAKMMLELLSMRQFPASRLPADCDRKADYLWQRSREDFRAGSNDCNVIYSGVDFLWMAALLTDTSDHYMAAAVAD